MKIKTDLLIYIAAVMAAVGIFVASPVEVSAADDWQLAGNVRDSYFLNIDFTELSSDRVFYSNYYHFSFDLTSFENPDNRYLQDNAVFFYLVKRSPVYIDRTYDYSLHLLAVYTENGTDAHIGNFYYSLDQSINGKFLSTSIRWPSASSTRPHFIKDVPALSDSSSGVKSVTVDTDLPIFENNQAAKAYIETGDMSGCINPETLDPNYIPEFDIDNADSSSSFGLNDFSVDWNNPDLSVSWDGFWFKNDTLSSYKYKFVHAVAEYRDNQDQFFDSVDLGIYSVDDNGFIAQPYSLLDRRVPGIYLYSVSCTPYVADSNTQICSGVVSKKAWDSGGSRTYLDSKDFFDGWQYDSDTYFVGSTANINRSNKLDPFYQINWDRVECGLEDSLRKTNGIYIELVSGTSYFTFSTDQYYWSDRQIRLLFNDFVRFFYAQGIEWNNDMIFGLRIIPYYTTKSDERFYGRALVLRLTGTGDIDGFVESSNNPVLSDQEGDINSDVDYESVPTTPPIELGPADDLLSSNEFSFDNFFDYFISMGKAIYTGAGSFPALVNMVFGFMPAVYIQMIMFLLIVCIILRIIGR